MNKILFQVFLLSALLSTALCAQKQNSQNTNLLTSIIGKEFIKEIEISDSIRANGEGFICEKNQNFIVGAYVCKNNKNRWFLLLTQKKANSNTQKITDALEINLTKWKEGSIFQWGYCSEIHKKIDNYIAIYNPNDGDSIVPEKVWTPNVITGKFDSLNVKDFSCYSEPNGGEE